MTPAPTALDSLIGDAATAEMLRLLWQAPFPCTLQDDAFRLVDVNDAFVEFTGRARDDLIGLDPIELQPHEDQLFNLAFRDRVRENPADPTLPTLVERRFLDAAGRERWCRASRRTVVGEGGRALHLCLLQDTTAEHVAREQADRALHELHEWFEISASGMLLYDEAGLLVRSNRAFEALVGHVPVMLSDAPPELQHLLAWEHGAPHPDLTPGALPLERRATLALPDGRRQRLRAFVRRFESASQRRRVMAVVEDRSLEDERDIAQLELGAMMDTAGVGIATFEASRGWLQSAPRRSRKPGSEPKGTGLQAISRELVEPASRPDYERLQRALKAGERVEVRYAVRHPDMGVRWLLTRVEPGRLVSGEHTTSVVTLDVTEQEREKQRNTRLLHEFELMFNLSEVGIAYVQDGRIVRGNEALAAITGYAVAELTTLTQADLFEDTAAWQAWSAHAESRLAQRGRWSAERQLRRRDGSLLWVQVHKRLVDEADPGAGLICSYVDVDERHRARAFLQLQAERTRAILDSVLVGIVTVGEGGIEWMNRSARRMFGGELADFVGESIATVATSDPDHPLRRTHYLHALAEGQAESFECRLKARDGREFWVVGNAVVTGRDAGGARQLTFALLDIERRRQAEVRIAQAQASLARIIETAPLAIGLVDARTLRLLQMNQMAAMFAGWSIEHAQGRTLEELFEPPCAAALIADLRAAADSRDVVRREIQRGEGSDARLWDTRFVALGGAAPDQLLIVASDVTEQRAAEQARYEAAVEQREMLVREVHHRIKNNLQGVAGLMQQIAQRRPEVAPIIAEAIGQVQAIAQVYGLQVGTAGPLRLKSVVEAIAQSVQRMHGRTIDVRVDGAPHRWALPEIESIPIALTINELLGNAVKHGAPGNVRCVVDFGDAHVRVTIANPGQLPQGFDLARVPGGVLGLGLVRALLPRRSATLSVAQQGLEVQATMTLAPPGVTLLEPL